MERADEYVTLVCRYLHLSEDAVKSKCRVHELCEARQVISYILLLHTKLSLNRIAKLLNYISHASPWRDKKQVQNFLDIDKKFAFKYSQLLQDAQAMADEYAQRVNALNSIKPIELGDVCWFWNDSSPVKFPIIGILARLYLNEYKEKKFIAREHPGKYYSFCVYAGDRILPDVFRKQLAEVNQKDINLPSFITEAIPA